MKLIIRVDDFGFSEAVNYGVIKSYESGLVRNIGLMSNMPYAEHAYHLIKDKEDVFLGLHVNLILGDPCAEKALIPSLLDENGKFISSKIRRLEAQQQLDYFNYDEVVIEVKAQIQRFIDICGKYPDYIDAHAVCTPNSERAISDAATAYGINIQGHRSDNPWKVIQTDYTNSDFYEKNLPFVDFFKNHLQYSDGINLVVFHPGFIDYDVIINSSLTINRCKDVALLCDEEVKQYIKDNVELLNFKEAGVMNGR